MSSRKPTLALTTPTTSSFPAEALKSAASVRTPHSAIWRETAGLPSAGLPSAGLLSAGLPSAGLHSAGLQSPIVAIKTEEGLLKTPISPPVAYTDFLKMHSPIAPSPSSAFPPVTSQPGSNTANPASTSRPRLLHRASISGSGPVKIPPSSLSLGCTARKTNPAAASSTSLSSASSSDEESTELLATDDALDSGPSTAASSTGTDTSCACACESDKSDRADESKRAYKSPKIARIDTSIPPSPFSARHHNVPMSAPAVGHTTFPSLKTPISPAVGNLASSLKGGLNPSQVNSPIRSPFSAKSTIASAFDWESALKARYAEFTSPKTQQQPETTAVCSTCSKCRKAPTTPATAPIVTTDTSAPASAGGKTSIRHIREVVTRTVTYTPRMQAAPKGKKRKIECDEH